MSWPFKIEESKREDILEKARRLNKRNVKPSQGTSETNLNNSNKGKTSYSETMKQARDKFVMQTKQEREDGQDSIGPKKGSLILRSTKTIEDVSNKKKETPADPTKVINAYEKGSQR